MVIAPINSYKDFCSEFVPEQYKRSEKLLGLIAEALEQCDLIENALHELFDSLNIQDAVGPALDYIGALVGVERVPGQTDDAYRARILQDTSSAGLPTPEALRNFLKFATGVDRIGLFPDWPCGIYFVLYGEPRLEFATIEQQVSPSGCKVARGTFLRCEDDGPYICDEDHGQPIVIDYTVKDLELYELTTDTGDGLVDENGDKIVALDF